MRSVALITNDSNVLRDGGVQQEALKWQASAAKRLMVIVMNTHHTRQRPRRINQSLWLFPTNAYIGWLNPFLALMIARRELFFQGQLQADVVSGDDPFAAGFVAWLIARRYRRAFHLYIGEDMFSPRYLRESLGNMFRAPWVRFMLESADAMRVGSNGTRIALSEISPSLLDRATMTLPHIDLDALSQAPVQTDLRAKYPQFNFLILVVAPLTREQNVGTALTILAHVLRAYPHAGLVIVGDGRMRRKLERAAERMGIAERVAFEHASTDIFSYLKTAHVCLVTALRQEHDNILAKAAAASCAIVTPNIGFAPEIIEDGESGFLYDVHDPAAAAAEITRMIQHQDVRNSVRLNALLAIERYAESNPSERLEPYATSWDQAIEKSGLATDAAAA